MCQMDGIALKMVHREKMGKRTMKSMCRECVSNVFEHSTEEKKKKNERWKHVEMVFQVVCDTVNEVRSMMRCDHFSKHAQCYPLSVTTLNPLTKCHNMIWCMHNCTNALSSSNIMFNVGDDDIRFLSV